MKACVITHPFLDLYKGEVQVIHKFSKLLGDLYEDVLVIPNEEIKKIHSKKLIFYICTYLIAEIAICYTIAKIYKKIDVVFFVGWAPSIACVITKILGKDIIFVLHTSMSEGVRKSYRNHLFGYVGIALSKFVKSIEYLDCTLADMIFVDSEILSQQLRMNVKNDKIKVCSSIYVDINLFKINKPITTRKNIVGYIGRFSEEKGVINLLDAIPQTLNQKNNNIEFKIVGDGPLSSKLKEISKNIPDGKIEFTGWIPYSELPNHLNEMKLLVLPSYSEGIPNVVLEAMACGTPVLATSVGGIPNILVDEKTGFIMRSNLPNVISSDIIRSLDYLKIDEIVKNAHKVIEEGYTYDLRIIEFKEHLSQGK